ncbi:MAG: CRTAC1 family protein [Acidobacteriota bacterium]
MIDVKNSRRPSVHEVSPARAGRSLGRAGAWGLAVALLTLGASSAIGGEIAFENLAEDPAMGLDYTRARSATYAQVDALQQQSLVEPVEFASSLSLPHRAGGFPGVAMIDHDRDGDLDIYATNGPGAANSLFVNQLVETGDLVFVDRGAESGAGAVDQDSNGVCFGDLDNDGDDDLVVLGREMENRLFENLGDGTFQHVSSSGLEGGELSHIGCALGDIDGDGLLDVFVGNATDLSNQFGLAGVDSFAFNHRNQLFRNTGGLHFDDATASSGVLNLLALETDDPQPATITWAVAMVDVDGDGDIDIAQADDQASAPGPRRGLIHILINDGTGYFVDQPVDLNPFSVGNWMSMSFGDLDCDGQLDLFSSNFGDYGLAWLNSLFGLPPYQLGQEMSRWLLGRGDGTFIDPLGDGQASVFGWGSGIADLDNDGDLDILYHGGIDGYFTAFEDNPGVVLENDECSGTFTQNVDAFRGDYRRRGVHGVALGDLDRDGRLDVVTASEHLVPDGAPLVPSPIEHGDPDLDGVPAFWLQYTPNAEGLFTWGGLAMEPGDLTVERNRSTDVGGSAVIEAVGGVGAVTGGEVNRSGIGAVVSFTPFGGPTASSPVLGGSSYISQHALEKHFGLGDAHLGTAEIRWPSGVRNRLYRVRDGEHLVMPEIPCSFDAGLAYGPYRRCVARSVVELHRAELISKRHAVRLFVSALRAYRESQ